MRYVFKNKLLLVFFLLLFSSTLRSSQDFLTKLPAHLVLGQELKWEGFELKILTSQKNISLVLPLDIYVVAYNPSLDLSFTGSMNLALESLAARSYRETSIKDTDQIAPGIYKISYPFERTGEYKIKANFIALNGALTQLETTVQVNPSQSLMQYQKQSFMTMVMVGIIFVVIYLVRKKIFNK